LKESLNKPTRSLLFYYLPLISLFALRQRRCSSLKTSSRHSSSSRQSVSMDPPSSSRSERTQLPFAPIPGMQSNLSNVPKGNHASPKSACQSNKVRAPEISATSKVRSAPSKLVPTQGATSSCEPKFLFPFLLLFYGGFFLLFPVAVAL